MNFSIAQVAESNEIPLRHLIISSAIIVVLSLLVYANSFPGIFVLDDRPIVLNNPQVQGPLDLVTIFRSDYWGYGLNTGLSRPVTILSLALNRMLFGGSALSYHSVNVLLHAIVSMLGLRVLLAWGFTLPLALLSAAIFAVHPIHTEVVNEVVGRSELLAALFMFIGFVSARRESVSATFLTCAFFLLALFSKEHSIVFLLLLPCLDLFANGIHRVLQQRRWLYLSLFLTALFWLAWRHWMVVHLVPPYVVSVFHFDGVQISDSVRILTALKLQWLYLGKLIAPITLFAIYQNPNFPELVHSPFTVSGLAVLGGCLLLLAVIVVGLRHRSPAALFALLYILSFSITANLLFPIDETFAERLAYFPSFWFCSAVIALLLTFSSQPKLKQLCYGLIFVYLVLLAARCFVRNTDFSSPIALWRKDVLNDPKNFSALTSLAEHLCDQEMYAEAERTYVQALSVAGERSPQVLASWVNFLLRRERYFEALDPAHKAVELMRASKTNRIYSVMGQLAFAYTELKKFDEAWYWIEQGGTFYNDPSGDWDMRGRILEGLGRDAEAAAAYAQVKYWPVQSDGPMRYSLVLFRLGRLAESRDVLVERIKTYEDAEGWNALGVVQARLENWAEATVAFERAVQLEPQNKYYLENLAYANKSRATTNK